MKSRVFVLLMACFDARVRAGEFPAFRPQTIDRAVGKVCYALATADVDGDDKLDVVAATEDAVLWYRNPNWERCTVVKGATRPDNVCLAAHDLDGDGRIDFAVGAGWGPLGLRGTETLQWIGRARGTERWEVHPVGPVPSLHRLQFGDVTGTGRKALVAVPLQGHGVEEPKWGDGPGVRIRAYPIPDRPASVPWVSEIADEGLHTSHGLQTVDVDGDGKEEVLVAAWEGVFLLRRGATGRWNRERIGAGNQGPGAMRGASEVKLGRLPGGRRFVATIEPWHGHEVVVYTPPTSGVGLWDRHVVDGDVAGGHALWCVDLDGEDGDELVVGRRDGDHDLDRLPNHMGVLAYSLRAGGAADMAFDRHIIDDGGIAAEDLVAADLDGDGDIDLVAGGRETHNVRLYWNQRAVP